MERKVNDILTRSKSNLEAQRLLLNEGLNSDEIDRVMHRFFKKHRNEGIAHNQNHEHQAELISFSHNVRRNLQTQKDYYILHNIFQ